MGITRSSREKEDKDGPNGGILNINK